MKLKKFLKNNFRGIGTLGVISLWATIGAVWADLATVPLIGYCITGALLGLTVVAVKI